MNVIEAITAIMKEQDIRTGALASRLGKAQNTVNMRLNQKDLTVSKAAETLRVLDYKIVVMPRSATTPRGGIEVE